MARELRRKDKQLTEEEVIEVLNTASYGVLSTVGEDGIPYGVPLNFCYEDNHIYFHSAMDGHKLDNIEFNPQVSFCVVTDVELLPNEFNTKYKSVIAFGTVHEILAADKEKIFKLFLNKFSGEFLKAGMEYIRQAGDKARVFEIRVERKIGKGKK